MIILTKLLELLRDFQTSFFRKKALLHFFRKKALPKKIIVW
jgi:hypothetical protein